MKFFSDISLPFVDPILVFCLLLLIVLFAPIILRKFRIPGCIGLIIAGVFIGPHGFNLVMNDSSIELFGKIGLLYIMFLAGLEMDLLEFKRTRYRSIVFGAFTFFIPIIIGFFVSFYLFQFSVLSSILIGSLFSTHTLLSYPIASKLGIIKNEAVTITIGGTLITDTAVLIVLTLVTHIAENALSVWFWLTMLVSLTIFGVIALWVVPRVSRWFFRHFHFDASSQFIFVLSIMFLMSFMAKVAGIEPIIGAFMAGLALNKFIPEGSILMNRVVFIGNTLFIPIFLISVGMIINLEVLLNGTQALYYSGILIVVALITKYIAAWLTQKVFKYSKVERNVIFGLSSAHAAAILAVVIVGYRVHLINDYILNGSILIILVSCLVSSFITEIEGRKLAITESKKTSAKAKLSERILIPVSNPKTVDLLMSFALLVKDKKSHEPIYPLCVLLDDENLPQKIISSNQMLKNASQLAAASDIRLNTVIRVDINISDGINRAIKELIITNIILGWTGQTTSSKLFFGSILDKILAKTDKMVMIPHLKKAIQQTKQITVIVSPNAEIETGFHIWLSTIHQLSNNIEASIQFYGIKDSLQQIKEEIKSVHALEFFEWNIRENVADIISEKSDTNLLVFISARQRSVSYCSLIDNLPRQSYKLVEKFDFLIIYPEQLQGKTTNFTKRLDGLEVSPIQENIDRFNKITKTVRKVFKTSHQEDNSPKS
ncbi:MAG: cation:proton antiporter [Bacteroidota bacterium]